MAKLIYGSNVSVDGFTEDADGGFAWAPPDDEVFVAITELMASAGTYLYGRKMYETLAVWETDEALATHSPQAIVYAQTWQAAEKIVYSSTLTEVPTARTRIERRFEAEAVRELKATSASDVLIGGPHLAAEAFAAGLVDEVVLYVAPVILGGRNPALAATSRIDLTLIDERKFDSGIIQLRYRVA